jgi:hypothetical protein
VLDRNIRGPTVVEVRLDTLVAFGLRTDCTRQPNTGIQYVEFLLYYYIPSFQNILLAPARRRDVYAGPSQHADRCAQDLATVRVAVDISKLLQRH